MENVSLIADRNLLQLGQNPYPGRGIIVGVDQSGKHIVQVYWIMGRSENSRNRIFISNDKGDLLTDAADPSKVKDPSLIIYKAMSQNTDLAGNYDRYGVSNGDQTEYVGRYGLTREFNQKWRYEPDDPNFTPRISSVCTIQKEDNSYLIEMSLLKKSLFGTRCDTYQYSFSEITPGVGYCITTYSGDGDPLPSFTGDPYLVPLYGDSKYLAEGMWDVLSEDNRVSLAVKFIDIKTGAIQMKIINKYTRVNV